MKKVTVTAKTIEEAVSIALQKLNATQDQVNVSILEKPSRGFLGLIGSRPAKIEVELLATAVSQSEPEAAAEPVQVDEEDLTTEEILPAAESVPAEESQAAADAPQVDPVQEAKQFLEQVLLTMDVPARIEVKRKSDSILFDIIGENLGVIIGRRGQTLDSLQYLVNTVGNRHSSSYLRIQLDAENYRVKRKQTLEQLADRLAEKALKTSQSIKLEPMPSQERKVIHTRLQNRRNIHTYSEGKEPHRYIVIQAKK